MASLSSDCTTEAQIGSNKVRVIAKVRGSIYQESKISTQSSEAPWISVHKPDGEASTRVTVSFGDLSAESRVKESYELDYCYGKDEDNDVIFTREIKPLISEVYDCRNATIIACGAKGSGKTSVIQGTNEKVGLAKLAMAEILSMAEEHGKSVTLSSYEVYQDHIIDLLDPKRTSVLVYEDAQGKIQLKGLSEVHVKSISEFHKLNYSSRKPGQKIAELTRRVHQGLIIHVSSKNENIDRSCTGKMNFVDLAGYDDTRRKSTESSNFIEDTKVNKSLYALQNVIYALSANESHIPYRECKLTRMLQDSLGGKNRILMLTCLNPSFCKDSLYMINLASRTCQTINQTNLVSRKTPKTRLKVLSTCKSRIPTGSTSVKKETVSRLYLSSKKENVTGSAMKGRKLFDEASRMTKSGKGSFSSSISSKAKATKHKEKETSLPNVTKEKVPLEEEISLSVALEETSLVEKKAVTKAPVTFEEEYSLSVAPKDIEATSIVEKETTTPGVPNALEPTPQIEDDFMHCGEDNREEVRSKGSTEQGCTPDKENNGSSLDEAGSPPVSVRLRELANNLKALYTSTPLCINMSEENDVPSIGQFSNNNTKEPKTPTTDNSRLDDKLEAASPWETFSMRSSRMKNSLVQEFLRFLNTASKDELKALKGIGDKRATYILELREESSEPFKNLDILYNIGLSTKQVKEIMRKLAGDLLC